SERKAIYGRLLAIQNETGGRGSRGFARYLVAICIGVAATLVWQSYGEAARRIIATRTLELGWSPETKQMIAGWVGRLGWRPPQTVASTPKPPALPSPDVKQVQQIEADIAAVRQAVERQLADVRETVEQLAAGQDHIVREITKLQ